MQESLIFWKPCPELSGCNRLCTLCKLAQEMADQTSDRSTNRNSLIIAATAAEFRQKAQNF